MDIEKTIELITGRLHQVAELQFELATRQSRQEETISLLVSAVGQLRDHAEKLTEERFRRIDQRFEEIAQRFEEMGQRMDRGFRELREAQQHTDKNLNDLIKIVDDLIRRDGQGR